MGSLNLNGPILANKVLCDNKVVAENTTVSLPEGAMQTVDFPAMGTLSLPIPLTDNLEASVQVNGLDKNVFKMLGLKSQRYEFRMVQDIVNRDGSRKKIGIKAYITGVCSTIPGGDINPGEEFSGTFTITATRYQLYVDGSEVVLIDKLNNILKLNGHDYAKEVNNLL
jgi:P2 family phage contractile tail tube protein